MSGYAAAESGDRRSAHQRLEIREDPSVARPAGGWQCRTAELCETSGRFGRKPGKTRQTAEVVGHRPGVELQGGRISIAHTPRDGPGRGRGVRRQRMNGLDDLGARLAVERAVMKLDVQGEAPTWKTRDVVETLDHIGFPERLAAIERPRMDPRHLDTELPPISRLRQRDVPHVKLHVDVGILDPVRPVRRDRHRNEPPAENRRGIEPRFEEAQHVPEADPALRRRRWVIDRQTSNVHVLVPALELQEDVVETGELFHVRTGASKVLPALRRVHPGNARRGIARSLHPFGRALNHLRFCNAAQVVRASDRSDPGRCLRPVAAAAPIVLPARHSPAHDGVRCAITLGLWSEPRCRPASGRGC